MVGLYPEYWIPRGVRSGEKELPELREKFTENTSTLAGVREWIYDATTQSQISFEDFQRVTDTYGQPITGFYEFLYSLEELAPEQDEQILQEIVDYILFNTTDIGVVNAFNRYAALSHLNWQASPAPPYQLMHRVLPEVQRNYLELLGRADAAASQCLSVAWNAAYSSAPDPEKAWRESIRAVETLLAPVVTPTAKKATLGSMKSTLRDGIQKGKWVCLIPADSAENSCAKFLKLLEMMEYEPGRHDASKDGTTVEAARTQVQLALTICQILMDKNFKRIDDVLSEEGV